MLTLATRKGVVIWSRTADGWRLVRDAHRGVNVMYAWRDVRSGTTWAALDHGHWGAKLSRSRDDGATWEEVAAPQYPEGEVFWHGYGDDRQPRPATNQGTWVMCAGGRPGELFAGTFPGGLFRSRDDGGSWELVRGLWDHPSRKDWFGGGKDVPGLHSIVVDPRDPAHLFVGISCGGVFESTDDGASWAPRNRGLRADFLPDDTVEVGHDPHHVLAVPGHPDVLWQQNHCGVFRSVDGGASWQETGRPEGVPHFGFPVAVGEDPDTAWVVPAQADDYRLVVGGALQVHRTRDGGTSWEPLGIGLPQEHCYDLVYRHAFVRHGSTMVMGTTTGNLYVSEDEGTTWEQLSAWLAPIHAVHLS